VKSVDLEPSVDLMVKMEYFFAWYQKKNYVHPFLYSSQPYMIFDRDDERIPEGDGIWEKIANFILYEDDEEFR
jgi:hypothetical protein